MAKKNPLKLATMLIFIAAAVSAFAGCSTNRHSYAAQPTHVVTAPDEAHARDRTALGVGETLQVRLPYQAGTGYEWRLASDITASPVIRLDRHDTEPTTSGASMPSARMFDQFTFRGAGPGQVTLTFVYARPWEKNVPPARQFDLDVQVK